MLKHAKIVIIQTLFYYQENMINKHIVPEKRYICKLESKKEQSMKYIGAHVSASGGVEFAPVNAHEIGANAFALFTRTSANG